MSPGDIFILAFAIAAAVGVITSIFLDLLKEGHVGMAFGLIAFVVALVVLSVFRDRLGS